MAKNELLPKNSIINESCTTLLIQHISEYLIHNRKEFFQQGFSVFCSKTGLEIIYRKNRYSLSVIFYERSYHWYLVPYNHSYFMTESITVKSFPIILTAIKEHEERTLKK